MEINIDSMSDMTFSVEGLRGLNKNDYITSCMETHKNWEPNVTVKFLEILRSSSKLNDKKIVIDCGACFGYYSIISAELGFDVIAFEPNALAHNILEDNISKFGNNRIKLIKKALGNVEERKNLNIPEDNLGGASITDKETGGQEIDVAPLDALNLEDQILVYKIDAEGYEPKIIEGSMDTINRLCPDFILVEVSPKFVSVDSIIENIFQPLWGNDYLSFDIGLQDSGQIDQALETFIRYSSKDALRQELIQIPQSNFLFIKKDTSCVDGLSGSIWKDDLIMKWHHSYTQQLQRGDKTNKCEIAALKEENFKLFQELQKAADYQVELHKHLSFHQDIIAKQSEHISKVKEQFEALTKSLNQL